MRAIVYTERTELKRPANAVKIGSANPVFRDISRKVVGAKRGLHMYGLVEAL